MERSAKAQSSSLNVNKILFTRKKEEERFLTSKLSIDELVRGRGINS